MRPNRAKPPTLILPVALSSMVAFSYLATTARIDLERRRQARDAREVRFELLMLSESLGEISTRLTLAERNHARYLATRERAWVEGRPRVQSQTIADIGSLGRAQAGPDFLARRNVVRSEADAAFRSIQKCEDEGGTCSAGDSHVTRVLNLLAEMRANAKRELIESAEASRQQEENETRAIWLSVTIEIVVLASLILFARELVRSHVIWRRNLIARNEQLSETVQALRSEHERIRYSLESHLHSLAARLQKMGSLVPARESDSRRLADPTSLQHTGLDALKSDVQEIAESLETTARVAYGRISVSSVELIELVHLAWRDAEQDFERATLAKLGPFFPVQGDRRLLSQLVRNLLDHLLASGETDLAFSQTIEPVTDPVPHEEDGPWITCRLGVRTLVERGDPSSDTGHTLAQISPISTEDASLWPMILTRHGSAIRYRQTSEGPLFVFWLKLAKEKPTP